MAKFKLSPSMSRRLAANVSNISRAASGSSYREEGYSVKETSKQVADYTNKFGLPKTHPAVAAERRAKGVRLRNIRSSYREGREYEAEKENHKYVPLKGYEVKENNDYVRKAVAYMLEEDKKRSSLPTQGYKKVESDRDLTGTFKEIQKAQIASGHGRAALNARMAAHATPGSSGKGKGRGNWGHKGRPGARGGSA